MNLEQKFMEEVSRIKEPEVFIGVARILKVKLMREDADEPRPFSDVFNDTVAAFSQTARKRKREILRIMRAASQWTYTDDPASSDTEARPPSTGDEN